MYISTRFSGNFYAVPQPSIKSFNGISTSYLNQPSTTLHFSGISPKDWLEQNGDEIRDKQTEAYIAGNHQLEGELVARQQQLNSRIMHLMKTEPDETLLQYGDLLSTDNLEKIATEYPPGNLNNDMTQTYIRFALIKRALRGVPGTLETLNRHTRNYTLDDEAMYLAIQTYAKQETNDLEELCALVIIHIHSVSGEPTDDVLAYDRNPAAIQKQAADILKAVQPFGEKLFSTTIESDEIQGIPAEWGFLTSNEVLQTLKGNHPNQTSDDILIRAIIGCCQLFKATWFADKQAENDFRQGNVPQFIDDIIRSGVRDTELGEEAVQYAIDLGINITPYFLSDAALEDITGRKHSRPFIPSLDIFSEN